MRVFVIGLFFAFFAFLPREALAQKIQPGLWKLKVQLDEKGEKHEEMDVLVTDAQAGNYQVVVSSQVEGDHLVGVVLKKDRITFLRASKEAPYGFRYGYYGVLKADKKRISLSGSDFQVEKETNKPKIKPNHATGEIGYLELMDK